jgi:hypothetical protein
VSLEDEPGPFVVLDRGMERVSGEVAAEVGRRRTDEQVRVVLGDGRVVEVAPCDAVGGVGALEVA